MYQTAESAVGKISDAMSRMRELSIQAANGTLNSNDRENIALEFVQLQKEIVRIVSGTTFNGLALLDSAGALNTFVGTTTFQVGAEAPAPTSSPSPARSILTGPASSTSATPPSWKSARPPSPRRRSVPRLRPADHCRRARKYGANQNRFESVISQLQVAAENQTAARSRIMDADYAKETAALTWGQIRSRPAPPCWPRPTTCPRTCSRCSAANPPGVTRQLARVGPGRRRHLPAAAGFFPCHQP